MKRRMMASQFDNVRDDNDNDGHTVEDVETFEGLIPLIRSAVGLKGCSNPLVLRVRSVARGRNVRSRGFHS